MPSNSGVYPNYRIQSGFVCKDLNNKRISDEILKKDIKWICNNLNLNLKEERKISERSVNYYNESIEKVV